MLKSTLAIFLLCFSIHVCSQTAETARPISTNAASRFLNSIGSKFSKLQSDITKKTERTLNKLEKQEAKLYKKLYRKDSTAAKKIFANNAASYRSMRKKLAGADSSGKKLKEYLPHFDTLKTSLAFLEKNAGSNSQLAKQLDGTKGQLQQYESRMQVSNEIRKQLRERREQLGSQLKQFNMDRDMMAMNKEVYYYQQQLNEYKSILNDPQKAERKALALLKNSGLFRDFMKRNSILSQLFKLPDNYGTPESLAGLQTTASVQQLLNQRSAAGGPNAQQLFQQNMQQAQGQLKALKDKVNKLGSSGTALGDGGSMPNFKPNTQKTKPFLKRLEYGFNMQSQKAKGILPTTSDMALTAGYKLNDRSTIGIGASYKLGWGNGFKNIRLSHQGIGLRSYADIKIKGNFWITGGYEMNYQHEFTKYSQLQGISAWQRSGLVGLTKKYKIGRKTNNLQLLWDFLSYSQVPRTEAIKFRIGYKL